MLIVISGISFHRRSLDRGSTVLTMISKINANSPFANMKGQPNDFSKNGQLFKLYSHYEQPPLPHRDSRAKRTCAHAKVACRVDLRRTNVESKKPLKCIYLFILYLDYEQSPLLHRDSRAS